MEIKGKGGGSAVDASATLNLAQRFERLPLTRWQHKIFLIIATAWLFNSIALASLTFVLALVPVLLVSYGSGAVFTMGAVSFVIAAVVVLALGPGTKGRVLEEVST